MNWSANIAKYAFESSTHLTRDEIINHIKADAREAVAIELGFSDYAEARRSLAPDTKVDVRGAQHVWPQVQDRRSK